MASSVLVTIKNKACPVVLIAEKVRLKRHAERIIKERLNLYSIKNDRCHIVWLLQSLKRLGKQSNHEILEELCLDITEMLDYGYNSNDYRLHVCLAMLLDLCRDYPNTPITDRTVDEYVSHLSRLASSIKTIDKPTSHLLEVILGLLDPRRIPRYKTYEIGGNPNQYTCIAALQQALYRQYDCTQIVQLARICTQPKPRTPQQFYIQALAAAALSAYLDRTLEKLKTRAKYLRKTIKDKAKLFEKLVKLIIETVSGQIPIPLSLLTRLASDNEDNN